MLCYFSPLFYPDYILSCDKLRFKIEFATSDQMDMCIKALSVLPELNYYKSLKDYTFRHLIQFGQPGQSFAVGLDWNGVKQEDRLIGYIEFNPNKMLGGIYLQDGFVKSDSVFDEAKQEFISMRDEVTQLFLSVWRIVHNYSLELTLKRWDMAVDVSYNREDVQLIKDRRKYSQFFKSVEDFTEYLGCGSNAGRVKVYNKKLEAGLDYELTRIELTLDSLDYSKMAAVWPDIYVRRNIPVDSNKVLLQLLQRCDSSDLGYYLKRLDLKTRKKYIALLMDTKLEVREVHFNQLCDMVAESFCRPLL